jgi:hypothetical protein
MSITTEFKSDLRAAKKVWLPWHILLILGIACLVVVIVADRFGRLNMALPAYNCAVVFGFVIYLKSELRRYLWFWLLLTFLAIVHGIALWYIPWTSNWVPALGIAIISSADFCLILWIILAAKSLIEPDRP